MITIQLTEAEAARICYALEAESSEYSRKLFAHNKEHAMSASWGRTALLLEGARNECSAIVRRLEEQF